MRHAWVIVACAAALAACGQAAEGDQAAQSDMADMSEMANLAWFADEPEACGLEPQDRMEWGVGVNDSGHEMQEVQTAGVEKLRVWAAEDARLAVDGAVLTGRVSGPAWVAADVAAGRGLMAYLDSGEVLIEVGNEQFHCAHLPQE